MIVSMSEHMDRLDEQEEKCFFYVTVHPNGDTDSNFTARIVFENKKVWAQSFGDLLE